MKPRDALGASLSRGHMVVAEVRQEAGYQPLMAARQPGRMTSNIERASTTGRQAQDRRSRERNAEINPTGAVIGTSHWTLSTSDPTSMRAAATARTKRGTLSIIEPRLAQLARAGAYRVLAGSSLATG